MSAETRRFDDGHLAELRSLGAASAWVEGTVRLHALDYGGDRPPLVVLPGITSPAVTWDFVVAELRDVVRPVVLDLRGRGLSDAAASYALDDYAGDVEATVHALGLDRPLLLGHSLGARIAAAVAVRGNVALAGTIAIDPPLSGPGRGGYPTPRAAFVQQLAEGRAGTTADAVARHYPAWPRAELALRARWLRTCDEAAVLESHARFAEEDFFAIWPDVPAPAAVIRGADSPVVTPADASDLTAANPAAPVVAVAGAGHMVPWDRRDEFIAALRTLLAETFDIPPATLAAG
ncbi:alpha/beta hydrolase [Conexibacter stalactiti]|uniref:Alpha/beta hydrolase n=1 Tax=Conexibacter stalactiti TaxID=1940611 RepID=A0ABU4HNY6_9ACTN|nr:alpha/beta hydrolase [Conexibacter stalactiti]MDW5595026.1 alpha/beta hydrolase [Conexibacter stalactiti]MEC5035668.1 alpha/beta hydrolase [Conexibacter stalactiti]